jgi:hypothetical protein
VQPKDVERRMDSRVLVAAAWATLIGALTFAAGPLAVLSDHKVIAVIQTVLTYIMSPGLIVGAEVGSWDLQRP